MSERRSRRVWRHGPANGWCSTEDVLAAEEPLEIRVNGHSVAVTMRTPGDDEELAAGFLVSEGVIRSRPDVLGLRHYPRNREGNVIDVVLADGLSLDLGRLSRHVFGTSSCGVCGKAGIDSVRQRFPRIRERFRLTPRLLTECLEAMRSGQPGFARTGAVHAAALFAAADGRPLCVREDVGRHNAVDKVLGRLLLDDQLPARQTLLAVSGRVSFEIVQKALAGGVAVVAAVGAPTGLAVDFAVASGQTLVGFAREGRFNVYAGRGRIG